VVKKFFIFLIIVLKIFSIFNSIAQEKAFTEKEIEKRAITLFKKGNYTEAAPLFSQLLSLYPRDVRYNFYYGACLIELNEKIEESLKYLFFAQSKSDDPLVYFYIGRAYHLLYRFDDAINYYRNAISFSRKLAKKYNIPRLIEMCENGKALLNYLTDLTIVDVRRISKEKFFYSYELKDFDGKLIIKPKELKSKLDLKKEPVNTVIFLPNYSKRIFYSSYGKKGKNGKDIYYVDLLPDGTFSKPQLLPEPINTPDDEDFPFLFKDGKTLYFSSKGHNSMGGYDIFYSVYDSSKGKWSEPINLDFPINTPYDDFLYIVDNNQHYAYFTSNRETKGDFISVYKIIVDKNPVKKEIKNLEEAQALAKLEISPIEKIKTAEEKKAKENKNIYLIEDIKNEKVLAYDTTILSAPVLPLDKLDFKLLNYSPIITINDVIADLKKDISELEKNKKEINAQSLIALKLAYEKNKEANKLRDEAFQLNKKSQNVSDPIEREKLNYDAYNLIYKAEELEKQAITFFNLANTLNNVVKEIEKDISKVNSFCNAISQQSKVDEAIVEAANINKQRLIKSQNKYLSINESFKQRVNLINQKIKEINENEKILSQLNDSINALSEDESNENLINYLEFRKNTYQELINKQKKDLEELNNELKQINYLVNIIKEKQYKEEELQLSDNEKKQLAEELNEKEKQLEFQKAENIKKQFLVNIEDEQKKDYEQIKKEIVQEEKVKKELQNKEIKEEKVKEDVKEDKVLKEKVGVKQESILLPSDINSLFFQAELSRNIVNQKEDQLNSLKNKINLVNSDEEKNDLIKKINELEAELIEEKKNLSIIEQKISEYKNQINDANIPKSKEELVFEIVKYEVKHDYNDESRKKFSDINNLIENEENLKKSIISKVEKLNELQQKLINENNKDVRKNLKEQVVRLKSEINNDFELWYNLSDEISSKTNNVYKEIIEKYKINVTNNVPNTAKMLCKEIDELKIKSKDLKLKALSADNYEEKFDLIKKASIYDKIIVEKQKYLVDLYVESFTKSEKKDLVFSSPEDNKELLIDFTPTQNKVFLKAKYYERKAESLNEAIKNELDSLFQYYEKIEYQKDQKDVKVNLKEIESLEDRVYKNYYQIFKDKDSSFVLKNIIYDSKVNELLSNPSILQENKIFAKQYIAEKEALISSINEIKQDLEKAQTKKEKIEKIKKIIDLQDKALNYQNYAIDVLMDVSPDKIAPFNYLVKIDRMHLLEESPVITKDYELTDAEKSLLRNYLFTDENLLKKLKDNENKQMENNELNKIIVSNIKNIEELKEQIQKSDDKSKTDNLYKNLTNKIELTKKSIINKFENNKSINDFYYNTYDERLEQYRPTLITEDVKNGMAYEKEAQNDYYKALYLREKVNNIDNPKILYSLVNEIDSLEKEAIKKQEKALAIYFNLRKVSEAEDLQADVNKKIIKTEENQEIEKKEEVSIENIIEEKSVKKEFELKENNELSKKEKIEEIHPLEQEILSKEEPKIVSTETIKEKLSAEKTEDKFPGEVIQPKEEKISIVTERKEHTDLSSEAKAITSKFTIYSTSIYSKANPIPINPPMPEGLVFKVQIGAFYKPVKYDAFKGLHPITAEKLPNSKLYRYFLGLFYTEEAANMVKNYIRPLGYHDAFVVAFYNGKRISLNEARKIISDNKNYQKIIAEEKKEIKELITSIEEKKTHKISELSFKRKPEKLSTVTSERLPEQITTEKSLFFSVQIGVFKSNVSETYYSGLSPVYSEQVYGFFRYFVGRFKTKAEAENIKNKLISLGYSDAFVVAYYKGQRISISEALALIQKNNNITIKNSDILNIYKTPLTYELPDEYKDINIRELHYRIQIGVFRESPKPDKQVLLNEVANKYGLDVIKDENNFNIYFAGYFKTLIDAQNCKNELKELGFTDAFIIAYDGKKRIPLSIAQKILK